MLREMDAAARPQSPRLIDMGSYTMTVGGATPRAAAAPRHPLIEQFGSRPATAQTAAPRASYEPPAARSWMEPSVSRPATAQGVRGPSNCSRKARAIQLRNSAISASLERAVASRLHDRGAAPAPPPPAAAAPPPAAATPAAARTAAAPPSSHSGATAATAPVPNPSPAAAAAAARAEPPPRRRTAEPPRPMSACDKVVVANMERVRERLSKATSLRMDSEERKPIRPMPLPKWTPEAVAKTLGERLATKGMKCDLLFRRADVSGTGSLTHSEFRQLLQDMNIVMTDADFATFVHTIDKDDDGDISYGEWIAKYGAIIRGHEYRGLDLPIGEKEYVFEHKKTIPNWSLPEISQALETKLFSKSSNARKIFRLFDEDKSGTLTYAEYREALEFFNITMTDENFATMMAEIDTNRDMMVSYNEFLAKYGHLIAGHGYTGLDLGHSYKFVPPQTPPPDVGSNRLSVVLKDRLLTRPQMVRTAFLRADHQREGALSEADLRAVFARIGISVHNRTWSDFVDKLPKTEAAPPKVVYSHLLAEADCFLHGLGDRFSAGRDARPPPMPLAEEAAGDADVLDLETGRATGRGVRESFAAFAARQQLDDAPPGAPPSPRRPAPGPASPKRPAQPRGRVKRQSKPSVPKQLRVAKRTHGRKTVASQRHLVATLQRRIDQRLGPQAQPRKAFC